MSQESKRTHLRIVEVAERWGVSPNFVRREIWRGAIKSTRFGRTVRVSVAEVERYSEERTHETA